MLPRELNTENEDVEDSAIKVEDDNVALLQRIRTLWSEPSWTLRRKSRRKNIYKYTDNGVSIDEPNDLKMQKFSLFFLTS